MKALRLRLASLADLYLHHLSCAVRCAGNVATEDVCYLLDGLGIGHGVRMDKLLEASSYICSVLDKKTASNAGQALLAAQATQRAAAARTT